MVTITCSKGHHPPLEIFTFWGSLGRRFAQVLQLGIHGSVVFLFFELLDETL